MRDIGSLDLGGNFHGSILGMVLDAGLMVKFVLLLLLIFSVVSWAIIFFKFKYYRKINKENEDFYSDYLKSNKLSDVNTAARKYKISTTAEVFRVGYEELSKINSQIKETDRSGEGISLSSLDNIERSLNNASNSEMTKLESAIGFLATTGSASPFIGLFGTVWGIMETFQGIGARGSATLAVVAPGISEALIATAAGLAAAIPAVIFYNYFLNKSKKMVQEMDNFAAEFLNIVERYFIRK
ncbi:MAG TPA: protein TolQ [Smithellaceae bacterium]|jgi:biopolymer transport protein TolQ|nr:protein TolQ [Syntrophaceae bacterium]OPZ54201.1 MAG: Biopolymer transport protein ExbB [Deltaproteobacteria bacterium ADurb.BinA014]HNQ17694.1 protein TolQ [Smithellaceae bacterium]MBP8608460.1 protein TolQ [Syntrophaceae bacterium]HNT90312.1 protein TolQ [Smithellaceae bacterium]